MFSICFHSFHLSTVCHLISFMFYLRPRRDIHISCMATLACIIWVRHFGLTFMLSEWPTMVRFLTLYEWPAMVTFSYIIWFWMVTFSCIIWVIHIGTLSCIFWVTSNGSFSCRPFIWAILIGRTLSAEWPSMITLCCILWVTRNGHTFMFQPLSDP